MKWKIRSCGLAISIVHGGLVVYSMVLDFRGRKVYGLRLAKNGVRPDSAAGKRISFLQFRSILEKNASQNVWVDVQSGTVTERVPGELIGIVENESRMKIRLTRPSQIATFLQPGQRVIVDQCYRN